MTAAEIKARKRADYPYMLDYRTRWNDNDMYDHMNNSVYNFIIDSVVNDYCIKYAGLDPPTSTETPLVVHSHTDFISSIAYPAVAEVGLRVNKLGKSSVTYEVGIFEKGVEGVKAVGELVHVWTDRDKGRPRAQGMSDRLRNAFERIKVGSEPVAKL